MTNMRSQDYDPSALGDVDRVDALRIDPTVRVQSIGDFVRSGLIGLPVQITGSDAQKIAELWRALRPAEQARCHIPPYGLRFWNGSAMIVECSLCWECNNAFGFVGEEPCGFTFDANALPAAALLMQLRNVFTTGGA
ncbi:MAG TPA: hypothetical protein VM686_25370 [Polyangiaceae bacterium]|nr:hypothetical protein [Polyangiaceae bacterium]